MITHANQQQFFGAQQFIKTSVSAVVLTALGVVAPAMAQTDDSSAEQMALEEIVVTGQRASIESAQAIKRNADGIVDSIVAEDIGKLPDRSVTDALQRVPGVAVSRFDTPSDPEHFAGEGAGVNIRGLPQVRGELNGRDIFSADGGRGLSFDDVPAELMAGVDVHKTPTADMIEGGLGGIVNLRTRMPFDSDGQVISATVKANYGDLIEEGNLEYSGLYSNRWDTDFGEFGLLLDFSSSTIQSRADNFYVRAFHPRVPGTETEIEADRTVYVPRGADWRRNDYERKRDGQYIALQWAPNEDAELFLTAFRSEAERSWLENGFFVDAGGSFATYLPSKGADDWTYDGNDALISGTITTAQGNGVPFGTSTRLSDNTSETTDISTGFKWHLSDQLLISGDFQYVDSSSEGEDNTLGLVAYPDQITVSNLNTTDGTPSVGVQDGFLSDYRNYSYGQMMQILSKNTAESTAGRLDAEYSFDDSIVKSVKAGVRFSEKSADNRGGNTWSARYQPWMVGTSWEPFPSSDALPKIENPQYLTEFSFDDFQRGDTSVPTTGMMFQRELLNDFESITDAIVAATPSGSSAPDYSFVDFDSPDNINTQEEETQAAYVRMDFGFEELSMPIRGNIGVRYVQTDNLAKGQLSFPTFSVPTGETDDQGAAISEEPFYRPDQVYEGQNSYSNVLPSFNLQMEATDELMFRFGASKGIWRPEFSRLKAVLALSAEFKDNVEQPETIDDFDESMVNFTLDSQETNPYLEPMEANQYDLTAEWYFNENGGMVYAAVFRKDVSDFFRVSTTTLDEFEGFQDVTATQVINTGEAEINGLEVGLTKFFDELPEPFDGFGVQANYTYLDSSADVDESTAPVDTDGASYGEQPLEGISEHTYNLMAMYEKYGFYSRLAYNWRSEQLLSVGPNGWNGTNEGVTWNLPVYSDDYGQLDFTMGYNFNDNWSINFEAYNLSQSKQRGIIKQTGAGEHTAFVYSQDTRYSLGIRASF